MADVALAVSGVVLRPDLDRLARFPDLYGLTPAQRTVSLGSALATSPGWQRLRGRARIVVRTDPAPMVAVVGRFDTADGPLLDALGWQVADALARLRPVSYAEVERACAVLAQQLTDHLGTEGLATCRVVGLPRGGLIVAGVLGYVLGLSHDQLGGRATGPLVLVDDCMLSGARLRRWLDANATTDAVIAHLHSHPDARAAVLRAPGVSACLAAADLHDYAPQAHGAAYNAWHERWAKRSPDDFMVGQLDHVCYPWNEPDMLVWNAFREVAEPGWRVVPPEWSVKNRSEARGAVGEVEVCVPPTGDVRLGPAVLWADVGDALIAFDGDSGVAVELTGVGADFWNALVAAPDMTAAVNDLAQMYAAPAGQIAADVQGFVAELRSQGLAAGTS